MKITIKPKKQVLIKFVVLLAIMVGYFAYLSYKYDIVTGGFAAALSWSFFVLCTPIADAGFLLDFPLRLLFGIRMIASEIGVWVIAISLNLFALFSAPHYYDTTLLTQILHKVLTQPYPYWSIILLSCGGTFLSIRFGDELMDVLHHKDRSFFHSHQFKHEIILFVFFVLSLFFYYELISSLGIDTNISGL